MKLIEAEKAKDVIHEYFKSLMVNGASGTDVDRLAVGIGSCLRHDANLLKAIEALPSAEPNTTTHDSIPAETGKNDGDGTSGDCISRTQEIDALRNYLVGKRCPDDGTLTCRLIENEVINKLPSVQPKQQWIPVSERLPEEGKVVLTQAKFKDDVKMAVSSRIDYNYWTTWGTRDINIIAWMPLPENYQEGEQ